MLARTRSSPLQSFKRHFAVVRDLSSLSFSWWCEGEISFVLSHGRMCVHSLSLLLYVLQLSLSYMFARLNQRPAPHVWRFVQPRISGKTITNNFVCTMCCRITCAAVAVLCVRCCDFTICSTDFMVITADRYDVLPMAHDNICVQCPVPHADLQDVKCLIWWHSSKQYQKRTKTTMAQSSKISNIRSFGLRRATYAMTIQHCHRLKHPMA